MKKLISMVALAAILFGSIYAHTSVNTVKPGMQQDTVVKKKKVKVKKMKKDTTIRDTAKH